MKMNAYVAGVGMTRFGKFMDRGLKSIGGEAIDAAIADAGIAKSDIQAAWLGNAAAGLITGQESIRGQVILREVGIGGIPVINVENACASGSTAFNQACALVTAGVYDVVLAVGAEKMYSEDKSRSSAAFTGAVDVENLQAVIAELEAAAAASGADKDVGKNRSMFMDIYAKSAREYMAKYDAKPEHFAMVSAKTSYHGSLNPRAQFREALTVEAVLASPMIVEPMTRPMCSPIGDGAAAVVIVSERKKRELGLSNAVRVRSSVLLSGYDHEAGTEGVSARVVREAYEEAEVGADDLDIVELHDASAPAELISYETIGLCGPGGGIQLISDGVTKLGGRVPVSTSGGLLRKGHPLGATGVAQVVEITEQLQGRSGPRQVKGAKVGLCHNGGGSIRDEAAAQSAIVLSAS